jgi:hypothetical protein
MARRRTARRKSPRRSRAVSALSVFESYMYANILTQGALGTSPIGMVTGATDLQQNRVTTYGQSGFGYGSNTSMVTSGAGAISLGDMISEPGLALATIQSNVMNNYQSMFIQSVGTRIAFKFGKKLLRAPIASVNRNIFKPLAIGVRL